MNMKEEIKQHKTKLIGIGAVVVATIAVLGFIDSQSASISLVSPHENTRVFINQRAQTISSVPGEETEIEIGSGSHSILIAAPDHWPWKKDITLSGGEVRTIRPFVLPQQPRGTVIEPEAEEYDKINQRFEDIPTPSKSTRRYSHDESVAVWISNNNSIKAMWDSEKDPIRAFCNDGECTEEITVYEANGSIRALSFYKNRNDVVIFAAQDGIFALELDSEGTQNFQPVYEGSSPVFVKAPKQHSIYVKDGDGTIMQIQL